MERADGRIREERTRRRMSQAELAVAAGLVRSTVQRAEAGMPVSGESARALCSVLGLDASALGWEVPVTAPLGEAVPDAVPAGDAGPSRVTSPDGPDAWRASVASSWRGAVQGLRGRSGGDRRTIMALALASAAILGLVGVSVHRFAAASGFDGRMARALDEPPVPDANVADWAAAAVPRIGHLTFVDAPRHRDDIAYLFTDAGLDGYQRAMLDSGNYALVMDDQVVLSMAATGTARVSPDTLERRHARSWDVSVPARMSVERSNRGDNLDLRLDMHVVQVDGGGLRIERMSGDAPLPR